MDNFRVDDCSPANRITYHHDIRKTHDENSYSSIERSFTVVCNVYILMNHDMNYELYIEILMR